jgi:hypothetical protein
MKKIFTLISITLLLITTQSFGQFHLKAGPALGLNVNIASGDLTTDTYSGIGILLGGQLDMDFTPMIGLIVNVNIYDNKSISNSTTENQVDITDDISLGYFEIQPLFKLQIPKSGFYFFAGPGMGFNIEGSEKVTQTQGTNTPQVSKSTLKNLAFRFDLKGGAGFNISTGSLLDISPEVSFAYGLTNVFTDTFSHGRTWKCMSINFSTIFKFKAI